MVESSHARFDTAGWKHPQSCTSALVVLRNRTHAPKYPPYLPSLIHYQLSTLPSDRCWLPTNQFEGHLESPPDALHPATSVGVCTCPECSVGSPMGTLNIAPQRAGDSSAKGESSVVPLRCCHPPGLTHKNAPCLPKWQAYSTFMGHPP